MPSPGRENRCPVIRAASCRKDTRQLGHCTRRTAQCDEGHNHAIQDSDTSTLFHADHHGSGQSYPAIGDDEAHAQNSKGPDIFLHLWFNPKALEGSVAGVHVKSLALFNVWREPAIIGVFHTAAV